MIDTLRELTGRLAGVPRLELRAAALSVGVGFVLMIVKFIAYFITGSAAIFSDALESIVNVMASLVAAYSLAVAHAPADAEHPYGHGKIEFMSASFEGGMIMLAAFVIVVRTIDQMLRQDLAMPSLGLGMGLMAAAMAVNGAVGLYLIHIGRKRSAMVLEADGWHLISDAVTSVAALGALMLVKAFGWTWADPIGALLIAGYIAWMGLRILRRAAAGLMDEQDIEDERLLRGILDAHVGQAGKPPRIDSYHKLRHRHSGRYHWVDFHAQVPGHMSVHESHAIASSLEYEIEQALGEGKATAHVEPTPEDR